jgi:cation diffusion facilitator family transporter
MNRRSLTHYAWLSIAAAVVTIGMKSLAYWLTGSVGLLSDAVESLVNLVAAALALGMLTWAARPPDEDHLYGHSKAEYLASVVEGTLILLAAIAIIVAAVPRLIRPQPLEQAALGLAICALASAVNFGVARVLLSAGKEHRSITLEADAHHLLTDVWTSVGVIGGVAAVTLTGWERLDPLVAIAVAVNIVWSGYRLVHRSILGLMDAALPAEDHQRIEEVLDRYQADGIRFHALRTRQAAARRFVSVHVLVPGQWTVQQGHELLERIEADLRKALTDLHVATHLEPVEDPASMRDVDLDRSG